MLNLQGIAGHNLTAVGASRQEMFWLNIGNKRYVDDMTSCLKLDQ